MIRIYSAMPARMRISHRLGGYADVLRRECSAQRSASHWG